jgi:hypothetical protein|tara:strand:+ start:25 stop:753 length:729 start_codon:yes stop_codon:yes gene_type:complete
MSEFKFPTEEVELPSKGLLYPKDNPLSSGKVEIKYMTAKEEDILTNQSFIQKGTVLDKLLQSLIINKDIKTEDLFVGDKNALFVAARILGYGKEYKVTIAGKSETIDLTELENKPINEELFLKGVNKFTYKLESTGTILEFKLLNGHDEKKIERELAGLKKLSPNSSPELTTRLKHVILSVDGKEETKDIRDFVDNYFLARDARAFRKYVSDLSPDVDMEYVLEGGEEVSVPIGLNFFWPDA